MRHINTICLTLQNFDYEVFSGARRQERRWDPESTEQVEATDKATPQKLMTDAMFKLEHGKNDQIKAATVKPVIDHLTEYQSRMKDDYEQNSLLRTMFRVGKATNYEFLIVNRAVWSHVVPPHCRSNSTTPPLNLAKYIPLRRTPVRRTLATGLEVLSSLGIKHFLSYTEL